MPNGPWWTDMVRPGAMQSDLLGSQPASLQWSAARLKTTARKVPIRATDRMRRKPTNGGSQRRAPVTAATSPIRVPTATARLTRVSRIGIALLLRRNEHCPYVARGTYHQHPTLHGARGMGYTSIWKPLGQMPYSVSTARAAATMPAAKAQKIPAENKQIIAASQLPPPAEITTSS